MNERPQHIVVRQFMAEVLLTAIYFNFLNARIFMISNCYLDTEGESAWEDSPL